MKLLAIDAGNTRIKWGLHEDGSWRERGTLETSRAHEIESALARLAGFDRVLAANVAGEEVAIAIGQALRRFGVEPPWVLASVEQCGVRSGYAQPAQLGPDRWAALIAARQLYDGPCIVVNAGTTMTVDALSSDGVFVGGCIVPGYALMRNALSRNTARLKMQDGEFSYFPDNTGDSIASGALNALLGAIDRMHRYMAETGERDALVMLSGGDAAILAPLVSARVQVVDNLVLEGLLCIGATDV